MTPNRSQTGGQPAGAAASSLYHPPKAPLIVQRLWRLRQALAFRLSGHRRHNRLVIEEVAGRPIIVLPGVLNPKLFWSGAFMATHLTERLVPPGSRLLDMGSGSGIGVIFGACTAARAAAVDINPAAVHCTRLNVLLHRLEDRVTVHEGDLFAPVAGERFDVVLFNPPYFRGRARSPFEQALRATDVVERFAARLAMHLTERGHAAVTLASSGPIEEFLTVFRERGFQISVAAEERRLGETLVLFKLEGR